MFRVWSNNVNVLAQFCSALLRKIPTGYWKTPFTMKFTNRSPVLNPNRKYEEALEYHRQALVLIPQNASTYSAIGYIHSLMGNFESAIDYFHTVCTGFSWRTHHRFCYLLFHSGLGLQQKSSFFFSQPPNEVLFYNLVFHLNLLYFIDWVRNGLFGKLGIAIYFLCM